MGAVTRVRTPIGASLNFPAQSSGRLEPAGVHKLIQPTDTRGRYDFEPWSDCNRAKSLELERFQNITFAIRGSSKLNHIHLGTISKYLEQPELNVSSDRSGLIQNWFGPKLFAS